MNHLLKIDLVKKSRRKGYYDVYILNEKYTLSENIIVNYELLKGKEFTEEKFLKIIESNNDEKLMESVYNYISYQMRSEKEVVDYLIKKEASSEFINKCIDNLKQLNYINDYEFSKGLLESIIKNKKGPKYLENKLKIKGIEDSISKQILQRYDFLKEEEIINSVLDNIVDKNSILPIKKQKQKICEKLIRDGFSQSVIYNAVNKLEFSFKGKEKLKKEVGKILRNFELPKYSELSKYDLKNKLISKLLLKGYEYQDIKEIINEIEF